MVAMQGTRHPSKKKQGTRQQKKITHYVNCY